MYMHVFSILLFPKLKFWVPKKGMERYEFRTNANGTNEDEKSTNVPEVPKPTKKSK